MTDENRLTDRRRVLGAVAGLAALSGCVGDLPGIGESDDGGGGDDSGSDGGGDNGDAGDDAATSTPTATEAGMDETTASDETTTASDETTTESTEETVAESAQETPNVPVDPDAIDGAYPQYQYDAANTGASDTAGPTSTPDVAWAWLDERDEEASVTGHALANSVVYVSRVVGDQTQARVAAFEGTTGEVLWETDVGETTGRHRDLAVASGSVYLGVGQQIYSLNAGTGEVEWTSDAGQRPRPVVTADTLYTYDPGTVYALSHSDGSQKWSHAPEVSEDLIFVEPPAVRNDLVFVGAENLQALSASDGSVQWTVETPSVVSGAPTAGPDRVYVPTEDGDTLGVAHASGELEWQSSLMSEAFSYETTPAVAGDTVYLSSDDRLAALSRGDAGVQWELTEEFGLSFGTPVVADGVLYTQGVATIHAYDASTGDQLWTRESGGVSTTGSTPPMVADGYVYYRHGSEQFYALSA